MPYESLFSLPLPEVTQSFQFEIQFHMSNYSLSRKLLYHFSLPSLWVFLGLRSKRKMKETGACQPFPESSLSLWPPPVAPRSTYVASWHHEVHRVGSLILSASGELGDSGPWAFFSLMDSHTTLENSERICPEKSTDTQLLYHPVVISYWTLDFHKHLRVPTQCPKAKDTAHRPPTCIRDFTHYHLPQDAPKQAGALGASQEPEQYLSSSQFSYPLWPEKWHVPHQTTLPS